MKTLERTYFIMNGHLTSIHWNMIFSVFVQLSAIFHSLFPCLSPPQSSPDIFFLHLIFLYHCYLHCSDFSSFQCIFITLWTNAVALIRKMHQKMQNRIIEHYILSVHILSSFSSFVLYLQAGGDSSSVVAASRQHPTGFAPPAAAVCPESIWWAGTWTAKSGSAAA